jgi:LDH2 family malate/lactate/ureidoglycolate dehydrogenase
MRVDGFRPADEFKANMDNWIRRFRAAKAIEGHQVIIPGDPERVMEAQRTQDGIDLLDPVVQSLEELGKRFSIAL